MTMPPKGRPVLLETKRFALRSLKPSDASERWMNWLKDPEVMGPLNAPIRKWTAHELMAHIASANNNERYLIGIFDLTSKVQIGFYMVDIDPFHRRANFNVVIGAKSWWGKGVTTRRLGLLCFLRGQDIRRKFNVWIAQTAGIVFDHGVWRRVPIKTADSATFFVLHEKLSEIGFVDWARAQPGYVFEAIHEYKDPAKSTSKNLNRLMRAAGAHGGVEVLHCLRGDGIDEMREQQIDGRDRRLQAGHALGGDEHDNYGFRALGAAACRRLASAEITRAIDWSIFENLDFEKLAAARRRGKNDPAA
jgi:Acetyltransferase (GNAT) domain